MLMKLNILLPSLKEQQKIGSFFKELDDTVALHQLQLDLLKEQKKASYKRCSYRGYSSKAYEGQFCTL